MEIWRILATFKRFGVNYPITAGLVPDRFVVGSNNTMFSLKTNFTTLYFINNIKNKTVYLAMVVFIPLIALIIVLDKKNKEKMRYFLLMLIIAILPYMRYLVLTSHSLTHIFMTFRCQFATIMCFVLSFVYAIDKDRLLTDIKINKRKKN